MVQVELNNMYVNIGANNCSEKLWIKKKHWDLPFIHTTLRGA